MGLQRDGAVGSGPFSGSAGVPSARAAAEAGFGVRQLTRLHEAGVAAALGGPDRGLFDALLDVLLDVTGADSGAVHVVDAAAHRLKATAVRRLNLEVGGTREIELACERVCHAALDRRTRLSEPDVRTSRWLDEGARQALVRAGAMAFDATPLVAANGSLIAVASTYFRRPHRTADRRLRLADVLMRHAADFVGLARVQQMQRARHAESRRAAARAEEANRSKDQFLAMLTHELRQPLASVLPAFAIYQRSGSADCRQHAADVIEQQLRQMRRLLDDLGDATLASRGVVQLRREPVEIGALLAQVLESMQHVFDGRRHTVTLDLGSAPARVSVDPDRIRQVFSNLLHNAAAYTPPGGRIDVSIAVGEAAVRVSVRDSGVGIPPDALDRVFEFFERGTDQNAASSFGVGLAVVRQFVERHGGRVQVSSEPGRGSEFVVTLPLIPPEA